MIKKVSFGLQVPIVYAEKKHNKKIDHVVTSLQSDTGGDRSSKQANEIQQAHRSQIPKIQKIRALLNKV